MTPLLKITEDFSDERLDVVLARSFPDYSRVFLQKVLRQGGVTLNGTVQKPSYRVTVGDVIKVPSPLVGEGVDGGAKFRRVPPTSVLPHKGGGCQIL